MSKATVQFRNRAPGDASPIGAVLRDAFAGAAEAHLVEALAAAGALAVERIAIEEEQIIGYAAISPATLSPSAERPVFGLAPVAVARDQQRRGIGRRLVSDCLEKIRSQCPDCIVIVLGHPAYYAQFGFAPAAPYDVYWEGGEVGDAFQILADLAPTDGVRRLASYHPAFSKLS